jgi:hypothetical protein
MLATTETRQACRSLCSSEAADLYAIDVEATMCVHACVIVTIRSINDDIPNQVTNIELLQSLPSSTQRDYPSHDYLTVSLPTDGSGTRDQKSLTL